MGKSGQTPGIWLKGGAGAFWTAACRAALVACGINPENFGTYDQRADAQAKERKDYRDKRDGDAKKRGSKKRPHEPDCASRNGKTCSCVESANALKEMGPESWSLANSQSGHISQNAFYQGARADTCTNIPGEPGKHAGGYGYQDNKAFCMDHVGRSNDPGSDHFEITRREEQNKKYLQNKGVTKATMADIENSARGTAEIAAKGGESRINGKPTEEDKDRGAITPERKAKARLIAKAREGQAKELAKKENKGKRAGRSGRSGRKKPSSPSGKKGLKQAQQKVVECIIDAWKQSLDEMRNDVVDKYSVAANSKACQEQIALHNKKLPPGARPAKTFSDLPKARRDKINRDPDVKKALDKRTKELQKKKADTGPMGKGKKSPTEEECLEYQANWLATHRAKDGGLLPMEGRVPGKPKTTPTGFTNTNASNTTI
ncbi:hypothetical protein [Hyalangium gracile]|uniref:hypothetical protein n=1 Tax=Hyalangium gracile TaxID=394092 RepID=UPI001CCFC688|nr:hypothetical protein [Hyalangium gracile]